ncbi:hypothetical protein Tco_1422551 [Tanacetum coccineum]
MKEAIRAKHMDFENALEKKNLRMKEAIRAKHIDFENALERKNLRMKEAIWAKHMDFENLGISTDEISLAFELKCVLEINVFRPDSFFHSKVFPFYMCFARIASFILRFFLSRAFSKSMCFPRIASFILRLPFVCENKNEEYENKLH